MPDPRPNLGRTVFSVLFICALLIASLWILAPFIAAIVWATTIVIATWPILLALERRLGGKRSLATAVMTLVLLGVVFVPFLAAIGALLGSANGILEKAKAFQTMEVPPPPDWVGRVPLVGTRAAAAWQGFAGEGVKEFAASMEPYGKQVLRWFVTSAGSLGAALAQFLLTVIVAAVLYANGEAAADRVRRFARKLGGDRGEGAVVLAAQAIRGVALGVVVTAVGQAVLGGLGLAIAGVPFPGVLTAAMFMLCIAQVGPILVLLPAVAWLFWSGQTGWGSFLLVWTLIVGTMDNVVRPILIKKGADLPLILIFSGVIGGLVTLGLIGIFVGPVVLAVGHTLMEAWIDESEGPAAAEG